MKNGAALFTSAAFICPRIAQGTKSITAGNVLKFKDKSMNEVDEELVIMHKKMFEKFNYVIMIERIILKYLKKI